MSNQTVYVVVSKSLPGGFSVFGVFATWANAAEAASGGDLGEYEILTCQVQ